MFFGEDESPFQCLPPEMIVEVLSFADFNGKRESRSVCRRWRWILDHSSSGPLSFKINYEKATSNGIEGLLESEVHIEKLELRDIKMTWPVMNNSRNKFPPIQKISFCSGNCEETMITILQYGCVRTRSLVLGCRCFGHVRRDILSRMLSGIRWNQLTELILSVTAETVVESVITKYKLDKTHKGSHKNHAGGIELILKKATAPNLKILILRVFSFEGTDISAGVITLISAFMTSIERHSKTLKGLGLHISHHSIDAEIPINFSNIPATLFLAEQQKSIAENLKLESLDIGATHFDALVHLVPPCIWESNKLTKLSWIPLYGDMISLISAGRFVAVALVPTPGTPNANGMIQSLIQRNRNTLTNLSTTFIIGDIAVDSFQMSYLGPCPLLRDLTIYGFEERLNHQVQIPTVRKLTISFQDDNSIQNNCNWIIRTFVNLEIVQISIFPSILRNFELDWVQSLLVLPRLREIKLKWIIFYFEVDEFNVQTLIRQFCHDKPRLVFTMERRRESDLNDLHQLCRIKILPLPNPNNN